MDPAKLKGILDWPAAKTVKEVRSFIGFGNFYCRFVKGFSHLAHPLHDLLKKDKKFIWSEECQESFDQLKKRFTEEPVLMMPYDTRDRELLAIIRALKEWRHYIQRSGHTTIVLSDHDNLRHFKVPQTIGR
jgi:hypothetical protein